MSAARKGPATPARKSAPVKSATRKSASGTSSSPPASERKATHRRAVTIGKAVPDFSLPSTGGRTGRTRPARVNAWKKILNTLTIHYYGDRIATTNQP